MLRQGLTIGLIALIGCVLPSCDRDNDRNGNRRDRENGCARCCRPTATNQVEEKAPVAVEEMQEQIEFGAGNVAIEMEDKI